MTSQYFFKNTPQQKHTKKIVPGSAEWVRQEQQIVATYPSFPEKVAFIHSHLKEVSVLLKDKLAHLSKIETTKYFAFQLGVIEWVFKVASLTESSSENPDENEIKFTNFLVYYVRHTYPERGAEIFEMLYDFVDKITMLKERKLGFDSANNKKKPGYNADEFLRNALT